MGSAADMVKSNGPRPKKDAIDNAVDSVKEAAGSAASFIKDAFDPSAVYGSPDRATKGITEKDKKKGGY